MASDDAPLQLLLCLLRPAAVSRRTGAGGTLDGDGPRLEGQAGAGVEVGRRAAGACRARSKLRSDDELAGVVVVADTLDDSCRQVAYRLAPPAAIPFGPQNRLLSAAEIQSHNTSKSVWVIIDGSVYDVTTFVPAHVS